MLLISRPIPPTPLNCGWIPTGSKSFTPGIATTGTNSVLAPNLGASAQSDWHRVPYVALGWNNTQAGQEVKVYRNQQRWPTTYRLPNQSRYYDPQRSGYVFKGTDDLSGLEPGDYYYGVLVDRYGQAGFCEAREAPTDQAKVKWEGFRVTGVVFWDKNKDGDEDEGEPRYQGQATVTAQRGGTQVATTTTDQNGAYTFYLGKGEYEITLRVPDDWGASYPVGQQNSGLGLHS
ncbi:MAG: hypothetical protein HYV39_00245 [Candidatus Levybacteria bacterium]|nr:hypothetical protein [Candidatus Levybacteria bacterium]